MSRQRVGQTRRVPRPRNSWSGDSVCGGCQARQYEAPGYCIWRRWRNLFGGGRAPCSWIEVQLSNYVRTSQQCELRFDDRSSECTHSARTIYELESQWNAGAHARKYEVYFFA